MPGAERARPGLGLAVAAHRWSGRWLDRSVTVARAVHDGVWLGLASPALLHAIDDDCYGRAGRYRNPAYNRGDLHDWEAGVLDRFLPEGGRVVVTGAGGGREVLALLHRGREVAGYECNIGLAKAANRLLAAEGYPPCVAVARRDAWPDGAPRCAGVLVGWGSYMLMPGRSRRVAFLAGARRSLEAGAPIVVSFYAREGEPAYFRLVAGVANALRRPAGRPPVEVGDTVRPNFVHAFTEGELAGEMDEGGFKLALFSESPYGHAVGLARP